jgi:hypothetical protein
LATSKASRSAESTMNLLEVECEQKISPEGKSSHPGVRVMDLVELEGLNRSKSRCRAVLAVNLTSGRGG